MQNEDKIACIIVNYNSWKQTLRLVKNIINFSIINHIIIVDNCSTDASNAKLSKFKNEKYIYIETKHNGGYGFGNNIGIRMAQKLNDEFVLISNPDTYFNEACLIDMIEKYNAETNCSLMNAVETYMGVCAWKNISIFEDILNTSIIMNKILKSRYYSKNYFVGNGTVPVDIIQGSFLLVRTELMLKYGMYDEDFFLYEEEKVLYHKFNSAGYQAFTDLDVSFEHRHNEYGAKKISNYVTGKKRLIKSKILYLKKYKKLKGLFLVMSRLFFRLTILEMYMYSFILLTRRKINDRKNR
ncbi:MAG: glycosyltransferase family 2 protein [Lachnospiraceae bacterium]|nr:glycosyltransferase family 2 protein [Lachnospiraceae bacterium]